MSTREVNVPEYIKLKNNQYYTKHMDNIIVVQKFIEGKVIERCTASYEQLMISASMLGQIVKELIAFPELKENKKFGSRQENRIRINKLKDLFNNIGDNPYKEKILKDLEYKIELAKNLEKKFDFNVLNKMTKVNSHGDYLNTQLIYDSSNNEISVIDFEKARKMIVSYEIIESYCSLDKCVEDGVIDVDMLVKYFKEFVKYFKLNKYDLKYAPYLFLIRIVNSSYGYYEYNNDNSQVELLDFAFFRTRFSKYLYNNLQNISLKLIKEVGF